MPASRDANLLDVVAELEGRIENLVRWARAVRDLGACCHDVSADGLAVIAEAMLADAISAKARWQSCFDLACGRASRDPRASYAGSSTDSRDAGSTERSA